ncbi:MAG: GtrA family protein [Rhodocyclales bacterium]|nr:GtrA family protein [Rhodocyclales bacterium]
MKAMAIGERPLMAVGGEFLRYFVASIVALAVDMSLLIIFANYIHYAAAACISFLIGASVHYLISIAFVFRRRRLEHRQMTEIAVFVGSGVLALLVTIVVVALCVEILHASLPVAKLAAAGASFLFGYGARKLALF